MSSLDVAFLLGYPEISGGTNVILEHALGLRDRGCNVAIVTELPFDPQRLAWKPAAMELELLSHADCREREFDLSIATWWRSVYDLPFVPAKRYAYFVQSIESRFFSATEPDIKALADYTYRQPLPIVTEASWIARHLETLYGRACSLVLNGIDKRIFCEAGPVVQPRPANGIRVLVEGTLGVPFKRVEDTIALCQQAGMRDIWLLTASACESYPGVARVCSRVPMPEVGSVYRSCDVLVKLSTVEGMFGPPLEMMHCGGTAITSDVTGHDEYMRHGENGIVIRKGEDAEVIKYLRALQNDRAFLDTLKAGGRATAAQWPDWSQAFDGMLAFVKATCAAPLDGATTQAAMLSQLDAALRLAGPLHESPISELSGSEMLRRSLSKLKTKLARRIGFGGALEPSSNGHSKTPAAIVPEPLPAVAAAAPRSGHGPHRIAFVGDVTRFTSHMLTHATQDLRVAHWHAKGDITPGTRSALSQFAPDVTILFEPELFSLHEIEQLPGYVLGYCVADPNSQRLARLQAVFDTTQGASRAVIHADTNAVATLLHAGILALAALPLPIDITTVRTGDDFDTWQRRSLSVTVRDDAELSAQLSRHLAEPVIASGSGLSGDDRAATVLAQRCRMSVYPLEPAGNASLASAKVLRDIAAGCLVVAGDLEPDYGLMPGEHYIYYGHPAELGSLLRTALRHPDRQDVMRRRAFERVRAFDAAEMVARLIAEHVTGSRWAVDWRGQPKSAPRPEETANLAAKTESPADAAKGETDITMGETARAFK